MAGAQAVPAPRIRPLGWALLAIRLAAMAVLLAVCVPLHLITHALIGGRFWPRLFLAGIGAVAGLNLRVEGRPERGALLLANHVSWLDILALANASGTAFVAHDGLAAFPFLKWLCDMNQTLFIARDRRETVADQASDLRDALAQRPPFTLFPEGTTCDGTRILPFKSSLLAAIEPVPADLAVQPVALVYADAPRVSWVGEEPGLDNFRRILARLRPVHLTIRFLPPLASSDLANRKTIAAAAERAVAEVL
ncbi:1-acyl-sn-glycerol-3-phosphate acyltransferase [Erythrobacter sp. 3-20A1M]|uniref:lysophospholipid acyltransferase family protein n=1 Tax=Erythrobacter sp. 3-20A1M TaxID=2653850 RepID=UPI001BFC7AA1|nr:lysophospholipid acyltransferase family protein [Erythrobacter sp. 3-20A1M]QWC55993.1 1-acyl-sn-glycerol-3-phosphate acyltransferase [Erythrobacter sp. 3-20A1M]